DLAGRERRPHLGATTRFAECLRAFARDQPAELPVQRSLQRRAIEAGPVGDDLVDAQRDAHGFLRHRNASCSDAVNGFSSFAYSRLAARRMWLVLTGSGTAAARYAAFSAIERIEPPETFSFASALGSRSSRGVC